MSEYTKVLERIGDRVPMPEPAFERIEHRRERRRRNRRISAGVLGVVITAVLGLALASIQPFSTLQPRLTPPAPASNGWIAYTLADRGIYLVQEGQAPRLAVGTPGDGVAEWCPTFSPDGTHLAFTRVGADAESIRTFIAEVGDAGVVGRTERLVASFLGEYWRCPKWSPDGTRLLYTDAEGVWTVGTGTQEAPRLIWHLSGLVDAGWSPDGSLVAAVSRDGEVFVVSSEDGTFVSKADGPAGSTLSWAPSGDLIAVGQGDTGELSPVVLITVDDGALQELTASGRSFVGYGNPSWSPDGTSIALLDQHDTDRGIVIVRLADDTWYRIPIAGLDVPDIWSLRWAPDGLQVLVATGCSVYTIPADGSGAAVLVSSPDVHPQRCQLPPGLDWQPVFP